MENNYNYIFRVMQFDSETHRSILSIKVRTELMKFRIGWDFDRVVKKSIIHLPKKKEKWEIENPIIKFINKSVGYF